MKKPSAREVFSNDEWGVKNLVKNKLEGKIMFKAVHEKTKEEFTIIETIEKINEIIKEIEDGV